MTDLTDKWKKGELPVDKDYYIKLKCGLILIDYYCQLYDNCHFPNGIGFDSIPENHIAEVLAPVPSYEEWQLMQDDNKRLKHDVGNLGYKIKNQRKEIERQIAQNAQLKEQINHLLKTQARQFIDNQKLQVKAEKANDVVNIDTARQIKQLKELLKECKPYIALYTENNKHIGFTPETANLLQRIKEVLK